MDKYIILSFEDDFLIFNQTNRVPSPDDIINSNKIYHDKYIYTLKYFIKNDKDILNIINKEIYKRKINKLYLEDHRLLDLILKFIKPLNIKSIYIKNFKALTINQCNLILVNKYLKYINCFYIPNSYIEKMKKLNKKVNINYVDSISDYFLMTQNVNSEDELYYKKSIHIYKNSDFKIKDIEEFFNLNVFLKTIHLHYSNKDVLESTIKKLTKDNRREVTILLYQDSSGFIENNFKYLKDLNKKIKKELNGEIKIIYTSNYIRNNLFKQLSYNNIKIGIILILYVIFIGLLFTYFYEYVSNININKLKYQLYIDSLNINESSSESSSMIEGIYTLDKSFISLLKINPDTVGWLTVNNTKIDYPVVQGKDNDYYLKRDFYKSKTSSGWIFMDYRNNSIDLDDNTIIYGHKLKSGLMFGTLSNVLDDSWYLDKNNQIVTFDTPSTKIQWQIFSIYKTPYTTEYLKTNFSTGNSFNEFVNEIKSKSIYDFNQDLTYGDKILTLSTCIGYTSSNQRLVIHAKLLK